MRRLPPHAWPAPGQAPLAGTPPPAGGGFTLIELLVTMMVAAIMAAAILGIYSSALHTFAAQQVRIQNQDDARLAINQMSRYLRMAASSEANLTTRSDAIAYAQAQDIVFYADLDGDGDTDKARYYLSGLALRMQTAAPDMSQAPPVYPAYQTDAVIIEGVRNGAAPLFRYSTYDEGAGSLVPLASTSTFDDREKILAVDISLVVNEIPELTASSIELDTRVQIRQRYDGGLE